ncbi:FERM and PDZ domain-containing protein 2-like [Mesoplodon densirostris]|uniref:FERM and PDZ domain-containing protein 2-like n=1 Tax=Mesoplodon densirostris TaxID=48708 RepID=UPI0028DC7383|nr:FERM and PDZ domain-containing protein 2-like [Mesoplodon densirostris]
MSVLNIRVGLSSRQLGAPKRSSGEKSELEARLEVGTDGKARLFLLGIRLPEAGLGGAWRELSSWQVLVIIRDRAGSGTKSNSACGSQRGKDMNHVWEAKKVVYPLSQTERAAGMSPASVTLASALQVRGEALSEEEIWSLLSLAAERLLEDLRGDSSDYVVCPWSVLLSTTGSLSFQDHVCHIEAAPFKAPELLPGQSDDEQSDAPQMHVYSLGMTMCEDQPGRRLPLQSILEACRIHWEEVAVHPASASLRIRQLVGLVLGTISEVERRAVEESSSGQQDRSYLLRNRLQQASCESRAARAPGCLHPCRVSERSTETQSFLEPRLSASAHSCCSLSVNSVLPAEVPPDLQEGRRLSSGSALPENSRLATSSGKGFLQRKGKFSRPEFALLAGEAPVILYLPGTIVTKKGKSYLALRALCVMLLNGQCLEVRCDITSTVGAIFSAVASFANLVELTYFGLAYMKGKEFFFLDAETRVCKIAPEGWSEQPQKKSSPDTFTLFLRIKFFVSHYGLLQHSWTRHQFYLQLRRDILEEKLYCNDEMLLQLGVLALQAEFGSYPEEQVESKAYFRVEDYIPASLIERMTALRVQVEVSELHRLSPVLWGEDAELEFLRVTQQLPEYGVLVYQVLPEKTRPGGEMALGLCAKGVIVYEVRNNSRIVTSRFQWREIEKILAYRKKFIITSSITGKKHMFVTDSAKTCKYLLGLCCAQHGFNAQTSSPGVTTVIFDYDKCVQMANLSLAHLAQSKPLTWIQRLSCSENALFVPRLEGVAGGLLHTSLDNFTVDTSKGTRAQGLRGRPCPVQLEHICLTQKPTTCDPLSGLPAQSTCTGAQNKRRRSFTAEPDREIVRVALSRDPRRGFGFVINEGEDVGKVDPGIFISSIIPGGPAEKAKKIKPGGQILALNHISLEGFTFDMAVRMIQNSPDNIELIISQSKGVCGNTSSEEKNSTANSGVFSTDSLSNGHLGSFSSHTQDQERNIEELEMARTQSLMPRLRPQLSAPPLKSSGSLQLGDERVLACHSACAQVGCDPLLKSTAPVRCSLPSSSLPLAQFHQPSLLSLLRLREENNASEIYFVELVKEDGTLGFSVTGGINTSVLCGGIYVKSIIPGGPAAKEGRILQGEDGVMLGSAFCGVMRPGLGDAAFKPCPTLTLMPCANDCLSRSWFPYLEKEMI